MCWRRLVFWLILSIYWCNADVVEPSLPSARPESVVTTVRPADLSRTTLKSSYSVLSETISKAVKDDDDDLYRKYLREIINSCKETETGGLFSSSHETCSTDDIACFTMAGNDKLGLEAIKALHIQLDDDRNGNVDLTETDDFLREELKYDSGYEKRQKAFHRNDDTHISVKELWEAWLRSEVHNWTIEQTSEWLALNVELPQYVSSFITHKISGSMLPRLAVNNMQLLNMLGIKDPIHKQKIALKAMDVVLFGPPKDHQPHWKDLTLIVLIIGVAVGGWYALQQNKKFKRHLHRMNRDMEGLQSAERALEDLQKELERARQAQENVATEKENLEKKLQEAGADSNGLHTSYSDLEISQLKQEIEMLRHELQIAEGELKDRCWSPPPGLQQWLQLTHEIENKSYLKKRLSAEKQLQHAREACEKLRKKRSSLVGAFVSTHGKSIDDVDRSIVEARTSLNEVTHELQERVHRWKQIEMLCGFNIVNNSGLQQLESSLYRTSSANGRGMFGLRGRMSNSQDDLDDDTSSIYAPTTGYSEMGVLHAWREADSSESETSRQEDDQQDVRTNPGQSTVEFVVGDGSPSYEELPSIVQKSLKPRSQISPSTRSISNNNILGNSLKSSPMIRSQSQDINFSPPENITLYSKASQSETSLDRQPRLKGMKQIKEQPSVCLEDEVYSTDSSLAEDEVKKRKRKLFGFTKKSKGKGD